jgi:hypothetical protein
VTKVIPCPRCRREAVGPKTDQFPGGVPVVFGRFTGGRNPIVVKCYRCTGSFKVDALMFNSIPEATETQMRNLGLT